MFIGIQRCPLCICKEINNGDLSKEQYRFYRKNQDDPHSNSNSNQGTRLKPLFYYCFFKFSHVIQGKFPGQLLPRQILLLSCILFHKGSKFRLLSFILFVC